MTPQQSQKIKMPPIVCSCIGVHACSPLQPFDEATAACVIAASTAGSPALYTLLACCRSDGSSMVSCSDDCTLKFWSCAGSPRAPSWKCLRTLSGYHGRPIYTVDWAPCGGDWVATGACP